MYALGPETIAYPANTTSPVAEVDPENAIGEKSSPAVSSMPLIESVCVVAAREDPIDIGCR